MVGVKKLARRKKWEQDTARITISVPQEVAEQIREEAKKGNISLATIAGGWVEHKAYEQLLREEGGRVIFLDENGSTIAELQPIKPGLKALKEYVAQKQKGGD